MFLVPSAVVDGSPLREILRNDTNMQKLSTYILKSAIAQLSSLLFCALFVLLNLFSCGGATAAFTNQACSYILIIDHSRSMSVITEKGVTSKGSDEQNIRLDAATLVIDSCRAGDRVAVVNFANDVEQLIPLTVITDANKRELCEKVHTRPRVDPGGTDFISALSNSIPVVDASISLGVLPKIILMTDGKLEAYMPGTQPKYKSSDESLKQILNLLRDRKVVADCVALGVQADTKMLRTIAIETFGGYYRANKGEDLPDVYLRILSADKGMLTMQSQSFFVWPGARELNIILFKNDPRPLLTLAPAGGCSYKPGDSGSHWSRSRGKAPQFYDFVRLASPLTNCAGDWHVGFEPKPKGNGEGCKVHVLQSAPFDFRLITPKGSKELAAEPCLFTAEIVPKDVMDPTLIQSVISRTSLKVTLQSPGKKIQVFDLGLTNQVFQAVQVLQEEGDYLADFVASFEPGQGSVWTLSMRRVFRVGPPDFGIELIEPVPGFSLTSPLAPLSVRGRFKKLDQLCPLNAPPTGAPVMVEIIKDNAVLFTSEAKTSGEEFALPMLNGGDRILDPGHYQVRASARSLEFSAKPCQASFDVGNWPDRPLPELKGAVSREGSAVAEVGKVIPFSTRLLDSGGKALGLGGMPDATWKVESIEFKIKRSDRTLSAVELTNIVIAPGTPAGEPARFEYQILSSGANRLTGEAKVKLACILAGRKRYEREVLVNLAPCEIQVPLVSGFKVDPLVVVFPEPVKPGVPAASGTFAISNTGETPLEFKVRLGDFKFDDVELPRNVFGLGTTGAPGESREITLTLAPASKTNLCVHVQIPKEMEDMRERIPGGRYRTQITVSPGPVSGGAPASGTQISVEFELH